MMKNNMKKYISLFCVLIWMGTIFIFSSQNGIKSSSTSGVFVSAIMDFISSIGLIHQGDMESVRDVVQFTVRKLAHFSIYMIGGMLIYNYIIRVSFIKKKILVSTIIGVIYAISDEIHQFFIQGRSMEIRDVLIDSTGVLIGVIILVAIINNVTTKTKTLLNEDKVKK